MKLNLVNVQPAPERPWSCELVAFMPEAVPAVLYGLWLKSQQYFWSTPEDARRARQMLAEVGSNLLMPCGADIVEAIDRLYRLFDSTFNQQFYTHWNEPDLPADIRPAIPVVPNPLGYANNSWRKAADITRDGWQNLLTGFENNTFGPSEDFRFLLREILDHLLENPGFNDDEIIEKLLTLIAAIG